MPLLNIEPRRPGNVGGTPHNLIRDPEVRKQIHAQKQTKVLHWLKTEIYSSPEILSLVLGLSKRQSLHKTLTGMEEQGLIRLARVPIVGGYQTLWGITEHGQAMAFDPSKNEKPLNRVFEGGKISALRLRHILGLQKMKWQATQASWSGWKNCDRGAKPQRRGGKQKHRPDALVIDPVGRVVAIELELTFKTAKRYAEEVIPSLARQICVEQTYQHVLWVCPTAEDTKRMKSLIQQATEQLSKSEGYVMRQLQEHKQRSGGMSIFRMGTADEWTKQWHGKADDRNKNLRALLWSHFQEASQAGKDLNSQAREEQEWMAATDHPLIQQTLTDYERALQERQQAAEAKRMQRMQLAEEAQRRQAAELAAHEEAERRANSLIGKVGKLLGK
jgi:hypothetical protein